MRTTLFLVTSLTLLSIANKSMAFEAKSYYAKKCLSCHSIGYKDTKDSKAPDLAAVFADETHGTKKVKKHTTKWITKFLKYPDGMINGDPDEAEYAKRDQHANDLWKHFNKKVMSEVELSNANLAALIKYVEQTAKDVRAKKTQPLKNK
jgi:cytochrome c2